VRADPPHGGEPATAPHDLEVMPCEHAARIDLPPKPGFRRCFGTWPTIRDRPTPSPPKSGSLRQGRKVLVLTERTEHLDAIHAALEAEPAPVRVHGRMSRKQRARSLQNSMHCRPMRRACLLATGKLVGEGFDHPPLDTLVLAMPVSWKGTLQQYAGTLASRARHQDRCADHRFRGHRPPGAARGCGTSASAGIGRWAKKRGAKAAFARGWRPAFSEIYLRNDGARAVFFRAGSDCLPVVMKAASRLFDASRGGVLPEERFGELEHFLATAAKSGHELRACDDALDFVAGRRDAARRAEVLDRLFPRGAADRKLAQLLKAPLYPYQAEGALFAVRAGRALIGDEMGLGKTIQAIAATEILARHFGVARVLVVCPTSLKYQWQSEISRFSGRTARVMAGGRTQRQKDFSADDFCKITNYEKLKPDLDLIAAWAPELVIVDEAQRIKNWNTIAARALKRIDSPYALVLTGTPLENKLEELISIVQFVDQHRLGPTWKLLHEHQVKDEFGRVTGYTGLERIGQTLAPILIRRRRSEVLTQLPEPHRPESAGADDRDADGASPGECRHRGSDREALAADEVSVGQGSAAAHLRPAEHAHVLQQHLSAGSGQPTTASRPTNWRRCSTASSFSRKRRRWCSASGPAPTTSSSAGWKIAASATSVSMAAFRRKGARRWSNAFAPIRTAASSCPPTQARRA
jgi:hypothetical protein